MFSFQVVYSCSLLVRVLNDNTPIRFCGVGNDRRSSPGRPLSAILYIKWPNWRYFGVSGQGHATTYDKSTTKPCWRVQRSWGDHPFRVRLLLFQSSNGLLKLKSLSDGGGLLTFEDLRKAKPKLANSWMAISSSCISPLLGKRWIEYAWGRTTRRSWT